MIQIWPPVSGAFATFARLRGRGRRGSLAETRAGALGTLGTLGRRARNCGLEFCRCQSRLLRAWGVGHTLQSSLGGCAGRGHRLRDLHVQQLIQLRIGILSIFDCAVVAAQAQLSLSPSELASRQGHVVIPSQLKRRSLPFKGRTSSCSQTRYVRIAFVRCLCTCVHKVGLYVHMCACRHVARYALICIHIHTYIYIYVYTHTSCISCGHTHIREQVGTNYIVMYIYIYICICIYNIHIHTCILN